MTSQILYACALLILLATSVNTSADPSPKPTQPLTTDDGRNLFFSIQAYGSTQAFQVSVGSTSDEAGKLKLGDGSVELLDQDGKLIPWTLIGEGFGFAGSRSGEASLSYKLPPGGSQIPTSVNFAWRGGKTHHFILTPDNFHHL